MRSNSLDISVTSTGTYHRDVRVASGYLSGDPTRVHFGFPAERELIKLEVRWPDGVVSIIEDPQAETLIRIVRSH